MSLLNNIFTYHACEAEEVNRLHLAKMPDKVQQHFNKVPRETIQRYKNFDVPLLMYRIQLDISLAMNQLNSIKLARIFGNTFPWRN